MFTGQAFSIFKSQINGKIIQPDNPDYDTARKVYNGMIDKYPGLIVYCENEDDVKASVNFARENGLLVAVRGGGHHGAGLGLCEEGVVIDLSAMKGIAIDPVDHTVTVGGGCTLAEMDQATQAQGLIVPAGVISSTGIGGLTLGGGLGHLTRRYGLSIDNLLEARIVLADGSAVNASEDMNSDLFWAIRGGGGNFGIGISFVFRAHPLTTVLGGPMFWHIEDAKEVMQWYREFVKSAPDTVTGFFVISGIPPNDHFPQPLQLKNICAIIWCCTGDELTANHYLESARRVKEPVLDWVGEMPFIVLQKLFDAMTPPGLDWYWKGDYVNELTDEAIAKHIHHGKLLPTWQSAMHLYPVNGVAARVDKNATAWNHRSATWAMVIAGVSSDTSQRSMITEWAKEYWNDLHPHSAGASYINFMMDEREGAVKASYGDNYERLVSIKDKYDPHNFFRVNQNIPPSPR